jgi:hypothetical protein
MEHTHTTQPYCMEGVIRRTDMHDPTFGVHQTEDGSFKIGRSDFKYTDSHVFVNNKKLHLDSGNCLL